MIVASFVAALREEGEVAPVVAPHGIPVTASGLSQA